MTKPDLKGAFHWALAGFFLLAAVVLLGGMLLAGAPGARQVTFAAGGIVALAVYGIGILAPTRRRREMALARRAEEERGRERMSEALANLQTFDLVGAEEGSADLPLDLAAGFSAAVRALDGLVQQIQNSSVEVAGAANAVHSTASELASGSQEQAAAAVEITATMEELARTAGQIASNAASQAELASQAEQSGNAGVTAVEEAVRGVEETQRGIATISARADSLGTRAKEIYRVLDLITDIAHETHILSLNAAIEAAAAGEHGRRFGVVAEEVRRLAQRSQESVDAVRNHLEEFTASIRATVVATEEGGKAAAQVVERAHSVAAVIEELRSALVDTARESRSISLATREQRTASDQVVLTLKEVSQVIQRMAGGLKTLSSTAERLHQLGLSIQLLTQAFHLSSPRSLKRLANSYARELESRGGNWEALESYLQDILRRSTFAELVFLVDEHGVMQSFGVNRELEGRKLPASLAIGNNLADRPWFQALQRQRDVVLTPLYESLVTGERCFTVAAPVRRADGGLQAVLGIDINARSWTRI